MAEIAAQQALPQPDRHRDRRARGVLQGRGLPPGLLPGQPGSGLLPGGRFPQAREGPQQVRRETQGQLRPRPTDIDGPVSSRRMGRDSTPLGGRGVAAGTILPHRSLTTRPANRAHSRPVSSQRVSELVMNREELRQYDRVYKAERIATECGHVYPPSGQGVTSLHGHVICGSERKQRISQGFYS